MAPLPVHAIPLCDLGFSSILSQTNILYMGYLRITNLQNCLQEGSRLGLQTVGSATHPIFGSGVGSKSDQNPNGLRKAADPFRIQTKKRRVKKEKEKGKQNNE